MNILDKIIAGKKIEIGEKKVLTPVRQLELSSFFLRNTISLKKNLLDESLSGIIAEFKKRSPSKGIINAGADVSIITRAYANNGASGLSVLTDQSFFGGSNNDLIAARENNIPILRKDFIIDEYQVIEAKSIGADVILLIAACLSPEDVKHLSSFARSLQLEVILEIHNREELDHICDEIDIVGVNNRDLKDFSVDINRSVELSERIPKDTFRITESGINSVENIRYLKQFGYKGFLIGENFMKAPDPAIAFASFVNQLKKGVT